MDRVELPQGCIASLLWGDSLFLTDKSPGVPGTHLIDFRRMKGWVDLEPPSGFEPRISGLVYPAA